MEERGRRILWAVTIAVAVAGVVGFEVTGEALTAYPVEWEQTTTELLATDADLEEGETFSEQVVVRVANATGIRATVEWTDDGGEPDRFRVTFMPSSGSDMVREEGVESPLVAEVSTGQMPRRDTIEASSYPAAHRQLITEHATSTEATWTVVVELVDAPGSNPAPGTPETQEDGSNRFSLRVEALTYRGMLGPPRSL